MSNKQQTAVEQFAIALYEKGFLKGNGDDIQELLEQAKEMERQQRKDAIKNELKLIGNYFDVSKLETKEQRHHIRFTSILKDRFDYYNETFGK